MDSGWAIFNRATSGARTFSEEFSSFQRSAVRVEMLASYHVSSESAAIDAYAQGASLPDDFNEDWLQVLDDARSREAVVKRLRVLPARPSPYLQFEIAAAYPLGLAAGENLRFILEADFWEIAGKDATCGDLWLFDDERLYLMIYDARGSFLGTLLLAEEDVAPLNELIKRAFEAGLTQDWASHEYLTRDLGHRQAY